MLKMQTVISLHHYQNESRKTWRKHESKELELLEASNGLASEAGEVCGKIQKLARSDNGSFAELLAGGFKALREAIMLEIGDVMYYCARVADFFGFTLEEAANANLRKLEKRYNENKIQGNGDNR